MCKGFSYAFHQLFPMSKTCHTKMDTPFWYWQYQSVVRVVPRCGILRTTAWYRLFPPSLAFGVDVLLLFWH